MKRKVVMAELKRHIVEILHINLVVDEINALFSQKGIRRTRTVYQLARHRSKVTNSEPIQTTTKLGNAKLHHEL